MGNIVCRYCGMILGTTSVSEKDVLGLCDMQKCLDQWAVENTPPESKGPLEPESSIEDIVIQIAKMNDDIKKLRSDMDTIMPK